MRGLYVVADQKHVLGDLPRKATRKALKAGLCAIEGEDD